MTKVEKKSVTLKGIFVPHEIANEIFADYTYRQYPATGDGGSTMWKSFDLYTHTWYGTATIINTNYNGSLFFVEIDGQQESKMVKEYELATKVFGKVI